MIASVFLLIAGLARAQSVAITHVDVVDTTGGPTRHDLNVVVRDGRIAAVGGAVPEGTPVVDGRGKFLIPGLWDMHVHLCWTKESALLLLLANGITGVRDLGGTLAEIDAWRTRIASGTLTGPRIYRAGPILNGHKFNIYQMVSGNPDETRGVVHALKEVGVDFIKVHRRMPRDSYFAAIDEAKKQGLDLVGHIPMTVSPEEASDAGQATIEHVATLFEGTFATATKDRKMAEALGEWRVKEGDALFVRFVKNHTVFDPTLFAYKPPLADPRSRYVALSFRKEGEKRPKPTPAELEESQAVYDEFVRVVGQANRDGVTIISGTDIAADRIPGFTMHDELEELVRAGLTPMQALQAATINSASVLHKRDDFGSIDPGKMADMVLLDADPLADIRNTRKIAAVIAGGKVFRRADLDRLLRDAEEMAQRE